MNEIKFIQIEGHEIPAIQTADNGICFSVQMIEEKLLRHFPNIIPENVPPLISIPLLPHHIDKLNTINAQRNMKFELLKDNASGIKVEDFIKFYIEIKKAYPHCAQKMSKSAQETCNIKEEGWILINHTVVPYVVLGNTKYLPMDVLIQSAVLNVPLEICSQLHDEQCQMLNGLCKTLKGNIKFDQETKFVPLHFVQDFNEVTIRYLDVVPGENPMNHAKQYFRNTKASLRQQSHKLPTVLTDSSNTNSQITAKSEICEGASLKDSSVKEVKSIQKLHIPVVREDIKSDPDTMNCNRMSPPNSTATSCTLQPVSALPKSKEDIQNSATSHKNIDVQPHLSMDSKVTEENKATKPPSTARDLTNLSHITTYDSGGLLQPTSAQTATSKDTTSTKSETLSQKNVLTKSSMATSKQSTGISGKSPPISTTSSAPNQSSNNAIPVLTKIKFEDKVLLCLNKEEEKFILLEAAGRLFFPHITIDIFIKTVKQTISNLTYCSDAEGNAFCRKFGLPENTMFKKELIDLNSIQQYLPHLREKFCSNNNKVKKRKSQDSHNDGLPNKQTIIEID